jgi:hypothetical protein
VKLEITFSGPDEIATLKNICEAAETKIEHDFNANPEKRFVDEEYNRIYTVINKVLDFPRGRTSFWAFWSSKTTKGEP